jgi:hypothetical protein
MLRSLKGRLFRITRLDECGAPVAGNCATVVSDGFIEVLYEPVIEAGPETFQKDIWGAVRIAAKGGDIVKRYNISIRLCEVHTTVLDIIAGAKITDIGNGRSVVSFGDIGSLDAFALEVWTKQAGQNNCTTDVDVPTVEWGYFSAPFITNGIAYGGWTINNGVLTLAVKGEAQRATAAWGETPYEENPLGVPFPEGYFISVAPTTVQPPALTDGCTPIGEFIIDGGFADSAPYMEFIDGGFASTTVYAEAFDGGSA